MQREGVKERVLCSVAVSWLRGMPHSKTCAIDEKKLVWDFGEQVDPVVGAPCMHAESLLRNHSSPNRALKVGYSCSFCSNLILSK